MDQVKFFKGCLLQILLGPFLNTFQSTSFGHMKARLTYNSKEHISYILLKLRFIKAQSRETLKILTGKKHPQINFKAFKKLEYGHLGGW